MNAFMNYDFFPKKIENKNENEKENDNENKQKKICFNNL